MSVADPFDLGKRGIIRGLLMSELLPDIRELATVAGHKVPGPGSAPLSVKRDTDGIWATISVTGELDIATAPLLADALHPEELPGGRTQVMVDVSGLTFCDSSGLAVLALAERKLRQRDGELILLHVPAFMAQLVQITGLDHYIPTDSFLDDSA